jgi:CheY-like chemotaxis protein
MSPAVATPIRSHSTKTPARYLLASLTVLVVDDNLINQEILGRQLRHLGCKTHIANHGGEVIEFLKTSRFWKGEEKSGKDISVILLDIEMPVMDGLTCARKIRELQDNGTLVDHVPIISVSANARSEQISKAKGAGVVCSSRFIACRITTKVLT